MDMILGLMILSFFAGVLVLVLVEKVRGSKAETDEVISRGF